MTEFLEGVVGLVEADSFAQHMLWAENRNRSEPKTWEQINPGLLETVGHLAEMPVCISLFKIRVGGDLLLFWYATSAVVDHRLIRAWMDATLPPSCRQRGGRLNSVDAQNFYNVFPVKAQPDE